MPDCTDDILRHFSTLLRRRDGSIAQMWECAEMVKGQPRSASASLLERDEF